MPPRLILVDGNKQCTKCKEWKPLEDFVTAINTTTGRAAACKNCVNSERKYKYHNDLEFKSKFKAQTKKSRLKLQYNLSVEAHNKMLESQKYRCKICNTPFDNSNNITSDRVDHCHKTGRIRGLLCGNCNLGLGNFKDNIESMKSAILYLMENQ
jgi:protein-arginine kinase activator protein McsA